MWMVVLNVDITLGNVFELKTEKNLSPIAFTLVWGVECYYLQHRHSHSHVFV
jgi:hypothetical protein